MQPWHCGRFRLDCTARTLIMGVVNTTPDSFSGDGVLAEAAIAQARAMLEAGADILDVGGESTRPGAEPVAAAEELRRVLPVVEALAHRVPVPISVDTTKAAVAGAVLDAGAAIINDISGGTFDADMLPLLARHDCGYAIMHLRGTPQTMGWSRQIGQPGGGDVLAEVAGFWRARLDEAKTAGIARERVALDPGFGFGKSIDENLRLLRDIDAFRAFELPLLIGTSRKSTIGKLLGDAPPQERQWGTAATVALAVAAGYHVVRVHDVAEMAQVARIADAVCRAM